MRELLLKNLCPLSSLPGGEEPVQWPASRDSERPQEREAEEGGSSGQERREGGRGSLLPPDLYYCTISITLHLL